MTHTPATASKWPYVKVLLIAATITVTLATGIGLAIHSAITDTTHTATPDHARDAVSVDQRRDRIAAAPMLQVSAADATSGTPALRELPGLVMPPATRIGSVGIPSGYPQTAEGAAVQLAEILVSVLESMEIEHGLRVQQEWFEHVDPEQTWPLLWVVQEFLRAGQLSDGLPVGSSLRVEPVAAQIKGSDGDGWHVACVLVKVTYTYLGQARLAYGHCERMTWTGDRWIVAAGEHPVPAPSTWPGTDLAVEAGWLTWRQG